MSMLSTLLSQNTKFLPPSLETGAATDPGNYVCVNCCNCQARNPLRKRSAVSYQLSAQTRTYQDRGANPWIALLIQLTVLINKADRCWLTAYPPPGAPDLSWKVQGSRFKVKSQGRHEFFMLYGWTEGPWKTALISFIKFISSPPPWIRIAWFQIFLSFLRQPDIKLIV